MAVLCRPSSSLAQSSNATLASFQLRDFQLRAFNRDAAFLYTPVRRNELGPKLERNGSKLRHQSPRRIRFKPCERTTHRALLHRAPSKPVCLLWRPMQRKRWAASGSGNGAGRRRVLSLTRVAMSPGQVRRLKRVPLSLYEEAHSLDGSGSKAEGRRPACQVALSVPNCRHCTI